MCKQLSYIYCYENITENSPFFDIELLCNEFISLQREYGCVDNMTFHFISLLKKWETAYVILQDKSQIDKAVTHKMFQYNFQRQIILRLIKVFHYKFITV